MQPVKTESPLEEDLGILYYSTCMPGIGGELRKRPEDFIVEEIIKEGLLAGPALEKLDRGDGNYSLAVLSKTSCDLLTIVSEISRMVGTEVGFAGIKDRRAVSHQLISINGILPKGDLLTGLEKASVRVVGRSKWALLPGDLRGNRFTITLRCIERHILPEDVANESWLPGYYGHQRFGTTRPNTHKVGRLLVKGNFEGAVREFLAQPYKNEPAEMHNARKALQASWDLKRGYSDFPISLALERGVIRRLIANPDDYEGALRFLPKTLLQLFVNSYQSFLFNCALSRRWARYDLAYAEIGDFIAPLDKWGSPSRSMKASGSNIDDLRRMILAKRAVPMVRVVGKKTSFEGVDAEIYKEILDEEAVSIDNFGSVLGMAFDGTLRFATFRPIRSDQPVISPDEFNREKQKVTLRFDLPKGCYATILLREIMRPKDPFSAGF